MTEYNQINEEKLLCGMYKPPFPSESCQNATLSVKFSNDIIVGKSLLDQWKIEYKEEDLEDGPWGKGLRIKRL